MNLPKIIDNDRKKLVETLDKLCDEYNDISIATGYWDLPGTDLLINKLEKFKKVRLLIGQEPLAPRYKTIDPEPDFPDKDIFNDLKNLEQSETHKELVIKIRNMIDNGALEVKIYKKSFFHAKAYIFGNYQTSENVAIVGSSNFTRAGLTGNTELNGLESDGRIVRSRPESQDQETGHLFWFDNFWDQAEEWSGEFSKILSTSPVGDVMFSPYEMYIATLYQIFKDELIDDELVNTEHTLYEFQMRNANLLLRKLRKYKLAMLSDSVGLGKTVTAGSVIKHYLDDPNGRQRVEIIVPASLKTQWEEELAKHYGIHDISVVSLQDERRVLQRRQIDKDAEVKLFVIDEAHNLRSESGSRYKMLFDWLSNNPNSHVLMLTATPINNQLADFANQIQLAAKGNKGTFKILYQANDKEQPRSRDFDEVIRSLDSTVKAQAKQGKTINFDRIKKNLRPVLSHFMVRATRQGIEKVYGGLKDQDGNISHFPESIVDELPYDFTHPQAEKIKDTLFSYEGTLPVGSIFAYNLEELLETTQRSSHPLKNLKKAPIERTDLNNTQPFDLIFHLLLSLGLPVYRDMLYMHRYYDKTPDELREFKLSREDSFKLRSQMSIHNFIRVSYLKRLESSPSALLISIGRYRDRLNEFGRMLEQGKLLRVKDIDALRSQAEDKDDTLSEGIESEYVDITDVTHNIEGLKEDIRLDLQLINVIESCVRVIADDDKKLEQFAAHLTRLQHTQPAGKKVLVFSFYADTVDYLQKKLPEITGDAINAQNAAFVSGRTKNQVEDYTRRFAPNAKNHELTPFETELDYMISTDVLSEGQNLQDCGVLINYDLHWNPVRMIQRNGRINRLGSPFDKVYVYNMHPAHQLEQYLRLVQRLNQKIDLIRNSVGTDQPILGGDATPIDFLEGGATEISVEQTVAAIKGDKNVIEALEEEADFSLGEDSFVADLRHFNTTADENTKRRVYEGIPYGKWGILPSRHATDPKTPQALSLVTFDVAKYEEVIGDHHRFFDVKPFDNRFEAYDTLAALSYIKTDPSDNSPAVDRISFDKQKVQDMVNAYGSMLAASEYRGGGEDKQPKPAQQRVLEHLLVKVGVDTNPIYDAIAHGNNRVYEKELTRAIKFAGEKLKDSLPLSDADVMAITGAAARLNDTDRNSHELMNMRILYNYAKQ